MPGGLLDDGESEIEGLNREVLEEISTDQLMVDNKLLVCKTKNQKTYNDRYIDLYVVIYECKLPTDASITISDEHKEFIWAEKSDVSKLLSDKYYKEDIDKILI